MMEEREKLFIAPFVAGLDAILVPKLIETGIDPGAAALKKAAEDKVGKTTAKAEGMLIDVLEGGSFASGSNAGCVVFLDGFMDRSTKESFEGVLQGDERWEYKLGASLVGLGKVIISYNLIPTSENIGLRPISINSLDISESISTS
jgi:hypothetical protein